MCNVFVRTDIKLGEEDMMVRVYKDIDVDDSEEENYKEVAIDVAIGFLGDWDVEILEDKDD